MIYFIQNTRTRDIKIGYSVDPPKRLQQLQTATPDPLSMIGVTVGEMDQEKLFHRRFAADRLRGEWFRETPQILLAARSLLDEPPRLAGKIIRTVYLAGKISGDNWRISILPQWRGVGGGVDDPTDPWPTIGGAVPIPDGRWLNYVGPYYTNIGFETHGGIGEGPHRFADEGWSDHCGEFRRTNALLVASHCREAIEGADLLFAWIDSDDCFGTLVEIGYAAATPCHVVVATPMRGPELRELWFSLAMADHLVFADTPETAWRLLWNRPEGDSFCYVDDHDCNLHACLQSP